MLDIVIIVAMPLIAIIAMILTFKIESVTGSIIFFIVSIIALSILLISFQKKDSIDKNKKFQLYELKLSDGTIVTDSLYSEKEYFYNKKGTKYYYKTYIIYSKKLN